MNGVPGSPKLVRERLDAGRQPLRVVEEENLGHDLRRYRDCAPGVTTPRARAPASSRRGRDNEPPRTAASTDWEPRRARSRPSAGEPLPFRPARASRDRRRAGLRPSARASRLRETRARAAPTSQRTRRRRRCNRRGLERRDHRQLQQLVESDRGGEIPGGPPDAELELAQRLRPPSRRTRRHRFPAVRRTRT